MLFAGASFADSFNVTPVRIHLSSRQKIETLVLTNTSNRPTVVQSFVRSWTQHDNRDIYRNSRGLIVVPPIVKIPAHSKQVMRVALQSALPINKEKTYRVFLREVLPPSPKTKHGEFMVRVVIELGLPVFIEPLRPAKSHLVWKLTHVSAHKINLLVRNTGNTHSRITKMLLKQGKRTLIQQPNVFDMLADSIHHWSFSVKSKINIHKPFVLISYNEDNQAHRYQLTWGHA